MNNKKNPNGNNNSEKDSNSSRNDSNPIDNQWDTPEIDNDFIVKKGEPNSDKIEKKEISKHED